MQTIATLVCAVGELSALCHLQVITCIALLVALLILLGLDAPASFGTWNGAGTCQLPGDGGPDVPGVRGGWPGRAEPHQGGVHVHERQLQLPQCALAQPHHL